MTITLGARGTEKILSAYGADFAKSSAAGVCALGTEWETLDHKTAFLANRTDALERGEVALALRKGAPFAIGRCAKKEGSSLLPFDLPQELQRAGDAERGVALWLFAKKGCTRYVKRLLEDRFDYFLCLPDGQGGITTVLFAVRKGESQAVLINESEGKGREPILASSSLGSEKRILLATEDARQRGGAASYVGKSKDADLRICRVIRGAKGAAFDLMMHGEYMESIAVPGSDSAVTSHGAFAYAAGRYCGMGDYEIRREFMKMVV